MIAAALTSMAFLQGYCVYGLAEFAYYALFPIAIYVTFLAEVRLVGPLHTQFGCIE
jgi:Predicted membrane protein